MGVQEERERGGSQDITAGPESRAQLRQMLLIGLVASVVGIAVALVIDWFPVAASTQAKQIDTLWDVLLIVSVPIFVLVEVVVLFSVWKFRMKPGEEHKDGPPIHGNTRLEIIWTAIPATLLVALCGYAYVVLTDIESAKADTMEIRVVGEQFAWTYYYPGAGEGGRELASNQLYLPVDRPVKFNVQSKDVIHDFWVPAFRMKIDAVPGITTNIRVTPNRVGTYPVVCAELCGLGHSVMRSTVNVVPRGTFNEWLARQRQAGQRGGGGGGGRRRRRPSTARRSSPRAPARVRELPHARRRGVRRDDGPESGRGPEGHEPRADPRVDRRSERRDRQGLLGGDHAAQLRRLARPP